MAVAVQAKRRVEVALLEQRFQVYFPYEVGMTETVKAIPGRAYDPMLRCWTLPAQKTAAESVRWFESGLGYLLSEDARKLCIKLLGPEKVTDALQIVNAAPLRAKLGRTLFDYQAHGVQYAVQSERCFLADEMGLGKTPQALAAVEEAFAYPCVIVCRASLKLNWKREVEAWLPKTRRCAVMATSKDRIPDPDLLDILIVNYDLLSRPARHKEGRKEIVTFPVVERILASWPDLRAVIVDESQDVKNLEALRTQATAQLAACCRYVFCLTGTPILSKPIELTGQLKVMRRLKAFGGYWEFARMYCDAKKGPHGWDVSGASNPIELNRKLRELCFIRRTKAQVLKELPAKSARVVVLPLSNEADYDRAENETRSFIKGGGTNNPAEAMVKLEKLKQLAALGKLEAAIDWVRALLESGEKLVLFVWHTEIAALLHAAFSGEAVRVTGETSTADRQICVDLFQRDEGTRLFIGNLRAAGVGLTLTAASNVAFLEFGWTPAEHFQAEDRVHRIGQEEAVTAWYLVAAGTVDEDIIELIGRKQDIVGQATDGRATAQKDSGQTILKNLIKKMRESNNGT